MKRLITLMTTVALLSVILPCLAETPTVFTDGDYQFVMLEDGTAEISKYTGEAENLTIPDTVKLLNGIGMKVARIGDSAFRECPSLVSVVIPDGVTAIGEYAFYRCFSLKSVTIPDSVTDIGEPAFAIYEAFGILPNQDVVITVGRDSYAALFCKDYNLKYVYADADEPSEEQSLCVDEKSSH